MRSREPVATTFPRTLGWLGAVFVSIMALLGPQATGLAAAAEDSSCSDVEVVFARGTFEAPGVGATGQAFVDALSARLGASDVRRAVLRVVIGGALGLAFTYGVGHLFGTAIG